MATENSQKVGAAAPDFEFDEFHKYLELHHLGEHDDGAVVSVRFNGGVGYVCVDSAKDLDESLADLVAKLALRRS